MCCIMTNVDGGACGCNYPDLMVEPSLEFWNEMLVLVKMLKTLTSKDYGFSHDGKGKIR